MKTAKHVVAFLALESLSLPLGKSRCVTGGAAAVSRTSPEVFHGVRVSPCVRANIFSTKKKKNPHSLPHTFWACVKSQAAPHVCCCTPARWLKNSTLHPPFILPMGVLWGAHTHAHTHAYSVQVCSDPLLTLIHSENR